MTEMMLLPDCATLVKPEIAFALPPLLPVPVLRPADLEGMSKPQLAFMAVDVVRGHATLTDPTVADNARRLGVSPVYVFAALKCTAGERAAILAGERPLILPDLDRDWVEALLDQAAGAQAERVNGNGHSAAGNGHANDNAAYGDDVVAR
jgi:hypothetical protein